MKSTEQIKADIDTLVRKQGNQGALSLGDVLDDIVDNLNVVNNMMANIPDVATFQAAVPNTATEIVFAYYGGVDLTGYTKSGNIGKDIDVYADGTKYAVVSGKTIFAPENSAEFFKDYSALTPLDLSNFNTTNVTDMRNMFSGCAALTSLDLSSFNTANVTGMSYMFSDCAELTSLDLSSFNTTNVTGMSYMFSDCAELTSLDLSSFNTTKVSNMGRMFSGCSALTTIIANDWSASVSSGSMFDNCTHLIGGNGTSYNSSHTNAAYAHIDVADNPGYFTAPA